MYTLPITIGTLCISYSVPIYEASCFASSYHLWNSTPMSSLKQWISDLILLIIVYASKTAISVLCSLADKPLKKSKLFFKMSSVKNVCQSSVFLTFSWRVLEQFCLSATSRNY